MRHTNALLARAAVTGVAALLLSPTLLRAASVPAGFTDRTIVSGLSAPTSMAFLPDGRLFVCQQGGAVRVIKNGMLLPGPFLTLAVDSTGERGLIGIAVDPQFASNRFVYLHYTVPGSGGAPHNRVSRFTASGDTAVPGSEVVLLELDPLTAATNHNGGAIHFGPDGKLYVAVGENANGANAQTLSNRKGKLLRINANGSIPSDNPFFASATGANRAIWVIGLRNPFTFAFDAPSGRMHINDVGQSAWEEIDLGVAGSNYGWPSTEGATSNPAFRGPLYAYGHGSGSFHGCAIAGGAFVPAGSRVFPAGYNGSYFFADLCGGWINRRAPGGQVTSFASGIATPVDLQFGPDGALYYLARGVGSTSGMVGRIAGPATGAMAAIDPTSSSVAQPFTATGWAIDSSAATGTGIDAIQVWAYPDPGSGQPALFVGAGEYGRTRTDVAARFGSAFTASGYAVSVRGLPPGPYQLVVFARSTVTHLYKSVSRIVTIRPSTRMFVDIPRAGSLVPSRFRVAGWALDGSAAAGTGVDAIHVWAYPAGSGAPVFVAANPAFMQRPDVGAIFGPAFTPSGFQLEGSLAPGAWTLVVFARSTRTLTFSQAVAVPIIVVAR
jgi:glucose/arabinose dehydrogenase